VSDNPDDKTDAAEAPLDPEPETESQPNLQTTEEGQTIIDVTTGNWKIYNQFIYYNPDENIWYCLQCRKVLESGKAAGLHGKEEHGFETKYVGKKLNVPSKTPEESEISRDVSQKLEDELLGSTGESSIISVDTADLALQINQKREAELVAQLVKNPEVTYIFVKMKENKLIYPSWTMADFFREGALVFAAMLGCYSDFGQNKEILKQNKHFAKIAVKISRAWEEYDAEEQYGEAVEKGETEKIAS